MRLMLNLDKVSLNVNKLCLIFAIVTVHAEHMLCAFMVNMGVNTNFKWIVDTTCTVDFYMMLPHISKGSHMPESMLQIIE